MDFSKVNKHKIVSLGLVNDKSFNRGNGRRLPSDPAKLALIPKTASTTGIATHEVEMAGTGWNDSWVEGTSQMWDNVLKQPVTKPIVQGLNPDEVFVCHFGVAEPIKRAPGSKALYYGGSSYFFLTWYDLFGASIKECEMGYARNGNRVRFLKHADSYEHSVIEGELKDLGYLSEAVCLTL